MMPPKKGSKRKATTQTDRSSATHGNAELSIPDRATWPGWVEMESEPAFFNVMLKEMGVRGAKVQEVYGLDEDMLAILPRPVHALIFLFRYKDTDQAQQQNAANNPKHVSFANQIPEYACATVALLNIVNNIKGLTMGKELRDFKEFTKDMNPMNRGDAIDDFSFAKRIHNSFARDNDLLNVDMHLKEKAAKAKKKQALAKAKETREAKKAGKTPLKEESTNVAATPKRSSARSVKPSAKSTKGSRRASTSSSPLSDPPDSDPDFETPSKATKSKKTNEPRRRSERKPKPRQSDFAASAAAEAENEGFHFIAYMPIDGHVWKLDGLDNYPQDMGTFDSASGGEWMSIARPALQTRMALYEGAETEFNLMAVVHDPIVKDRNELCKNVKEIQQIEKKLDGVVEDWRKLEGAVTKSDAITHVSAEYDISRADIDSVELAKTTLETIEKSDDLLELIDLRRKALCQQAGLRAVVRDAMQSAKDDDEKARHRRHDYGMFVRSWLGALAENELLSELLDEP